MKLKLLSGNQLKVLAAILMTIDHIGVMIFTQSEILRIIGRLSMPVFSYMISEGAHHTKNRKKYLFTMIVISFILQTVYYFALQSLSQCILVTFSLAIALIYVYDYAKKRNDITGFFFFGFSLFTVYFLTVILPVILKKTDYNIDYGFFGVILPLLIYIGKNKTQKLLMLTSGLVLVSLTNSPIQWYSLLSVPIIALYNEKRGRLKMKNFFYIFYPLHLLVIYFISNL